jgi:HSP20 family protein
MCPRDDDIIEDIKHLQETMERLLSDFAGMRTPLLLGKESVWRPLTDVYETEKEFVVRMDVAGMNPGDFDVLLHGRVLTIKGVRRDPTPTGRKHFHKMEISLGPFERNIAIPPDVQISSLEAHYENGYLMIRIDKGLKRLRYRERIIPVERGS